MQRRKLIIGTYDTALKGPWTLAACDFPEPDPQENLVDVPGRDGPLDLSTILTGGAPVFGSRELTATLECSEGDREYRTKLINEMINRLHGRRWPITLPDDPTHYVEGRVSINTEYNDLAHCAVKLTAACDPWKLKKVETRLTLELDADAQIVALPNAGARVLVPTIVLDGAGAWGEFTVDGQTWELDANGTYVIPELRLQPGTTALSYSGNGTATITYREAVL